MSAKYSGIRKNLIHMCPLPVHSVLAHECGMILSVTTQSYIVFQKNPLPHLLYKSNLDI